MTRKSQQPGPTYPNTSLDANKSAFVRGTFIATADHNYITARWCFSQNMNIDFFWLSLHALEKYMKAVLLLNGMSANEYFHDLPKLYEAIKQVVGEHLPDTFECPDQLTSIADIAWIDETPARFMERLYENGNAHNRYHTYGFSRYGADINKVDCMVYRIRRLCRKVDAEWTTHAKNPNDEDPSKGDILSSRPGNWKISGNLPLERAFSGKSQGNQTDEGLRRALLNMNFAFAPENYEHRPARLSMMFSNSDIPRALRSLEHEGGNEETREEGREMGQWLLDNVQLPEDVKCHIKDLMTR